MTDELTPDSVTTAVPTSQPSSWRCFGSAIVSGAIALALYRLTSAIALAFAHQAIHTNNWTVYRITVAVRTLVIGLSALGTGIFGLVALGLLGLGCQLLLQGRPDPTSNSQ